VWRPKQFEEFGWSFSIDGSARLLQLRDVQSGDQWEAGVLAGIWYQSLPPLATITGAGDRESRYVEAEFAASTRALWQEATCPVVGYPGADCPAGIFDYGLEARAELRRLGVPVLVDRVGTLQACARELEAETAVCAWITPADNSAAAWLSNLRTGGKPGIKRREPIAATLTDGHLPRFAIYANADILVVKIGSDGSLSRARRDEHTAEIESLVVAINELTGARVGVAYLGHSATGWSIARLSLQLPPWLPDTVMRWLFPRLFAVFSEGQGTPAATRR